MTIDFSNDATLIGRVPVADASYPQSTYQDKTTPSANDGTPSDRAKERKDWDGFRQALIALGQIVPSGDPDTATVSQLMDALKTWYASVFTIGNSTPANLNTQSRCEISAGYIRQSKTDGASYKLKSSLQGGGVYFSGTSPSNHPVTLRREYYDIDASDITYNATTQHISYIPAGGFTLTGIPQTAKIQGCGIETRSSSSGGTLQDSPVSTSMDMSGTWPLLQTARGAWSGTASIPSVVCRFWIDYDPINVD